MGEPLVGLFLSSNEKIASAQEHYNLEGRWSQYSQLLYVSQSITTYWAVALEKWLRLELLVQTIE